MLFEIDVTQNDPAAVIEHFWNQDDAPQDGREFAERIVHGVTERRDALDETIRSCAQHWKIERMAVVDRNVLRMAVYEILHDEEVPDIVAIDEAIELAKRFGGGDSGGFINGILDSVRRGAAGS